LSSHSLLTAPIGRSLLRLAGPTTAIMAVQILVAVADTWFVGQLGLEALAGIALVLPFITLMMNIANGGMGGAVASSMARALGAHRHEDARALVPHAMLLGWAIALTFTLLAWTLAPTVFQAMGGKGAALAQALTFTRLWFSGAVLQWTAAFLSALLRGVGDTATPARRPPR
jgi:Na+-driven multidrug efflux pump